MNKRSFVTCSAAALTVLASAACGSSSSTAPKGPTAQAAALHFDSLYAVAVANGSNWTNRSELLTLLEIAAASGANPTSVSVTVGGTAQAWSAVSLVVYDTNSSGTMADSQVATIAYSDYANVTNAIVTEAEYYPSSPTQYITDVFSDTVYATATTSTYTGTVTSTGASCGLVAGLQNAQIQEIRARYSCTELTLQSSATATFPPTTGLASSLQNISFSNISAPGIFLFQ
jgi:hypothetical protein